MRARLKIIQISTEALIPLLGFYLWDWSLYFILLFYILDMLADILFMNVKARKIYQFLNQISEKKIWINHSVLSSILWLLVIALIHVFILQVHSDMNVLQEIKSFWMYKDMGIEQGYFLLPLLFFASYQKYRMEFLMPARYKTLQMKSIWINYRRILLILIAFTGFGIGISTIIIFQEWTYVLTIVTGIAIYKSLQD